MVSSKVFVNYVRIHLSVHVSSVSIPVLIISQKLLLQRRS